MINLMNTPKVGQYLYATCSAENYGRIIAIGEDANGTPTIDIEVLQPVDLISSDEEASFPHPDLISLELSPGATIILRNLQWRFMDVLDGFVVIECRTPGNNCFRCTKVFWLKDNA